LAPPKDNRALTRCDTENRSRICQVLLGLDHAACAPCVPLVVQTVQTGPIGGGSQMVQIEVGSGNRCVSHPRLYGHRINSAGKPEAGCRMPQIMDATALRDGGPRQCSLECRGVQSMPRGGDAEEVVGLAASGQYATRAVGGMEAGSPAVSTGLDRVVWPSARAVRSAVFVSPRSGTGAIAG
jgi:hypothetical protein